MTPGTLTLSSLGWAPLIPLWGLAALLAVHARGINPATAALALWQEFCAARAALLPAPPPPEESALRRFT